MAPQTKDRRAIQRAGANKDFGWGLFLTARSNYEPIEQVTFVSVPSTREFDEETRAEWLKDNVEIAIQRLREVVSTAPDVLGGVPVLRGTRMPLSRVFAELADGFTIGQIAEEFELDSTQLETLLGSLSMLLDQPISPPNARLSTR